MATAVVTSAMFRTWPVRFPAIEFTFSVSSFHTPPTSDVGLTAKLAPVPTSWATRVTSSGERVQLVDHDVDRVFELEISPSTSTVTFLDRSPLATAVVTSAMFRTWLVRLLAMKLTLSVRSFQTPPTFVPGLGRSLPSVPTSRATQVTSGAE